MGKAAATVEVPGPAADAQALWLDPRRWPTFVDGFRALAKQEGDWPREGRIVWDSTPHGRGRVVEEIVEYVPGASHVVRVEDPRLRGTQTVTFTETGEAVRVEARLDYQLKQGNVLLDVLFIKRSQRDALKRTLRRFAAERVSDVSG